MTALRSEPYHLAQGHFNIIATVEALNVVGYGIPALNPVGADVKTEPHNPPRGPQRNDAGTTDTQIKVDYDMLSDPEDGGSPVLTLHLEWDQGKGVWSSLIGGTSYRKLTSFIVTGLTPGHWYNFRYRAKNDFGWGDFSDPVSVQAATMPVKIAPIQTSIVGKNIRISWFAPYNRGDPIHYYTIVIRNKAGDFIEDTTNCEG
jgi:hypothetical protein